MSDSTDTFIDRLLDGLALPEDIDDEVDSWSDSEDPRSLHEYLGLTWDEYSLWAERPSALRFIVAGRRERRGFRKIDSREVSRVHDYADDEQPLAAVARAAESAEAVDVLHWLRRTGRL